MTKLSPSRAWLDGALLVSLWASIVLGGLTLALARIAATYRFTLAIGIALGAGAVLIFRH